MPVCCRSTSAALHGGATSLPDRRREQRLLPSACAAFSAAAAVSAATSACRHRCSLAVLVPVADLGLAFSRQQEAPPSGSGRRAVCRRVSPVPSPERAGRDHRRRYGGDIAVRHHGAPAALPAAGFGPARRQHCQRQRDHDRELRQRLRERRITPDRILRRHDAAQLSYTPLLPYSLLGRSTTLSAQSMIRIRPDARGS